MRFSVFVCGISFFFLGSNLSDFERERDCALKLCKGGEIHKECILNNILLYVVGIQVLHTVEISDSQWLENTLNEEDF